METAENTYLTFKVGDGVFGVSVARVVEILEYKEPISRSNVQPYMLGLMEHRGGVIPLIDTGVKFGMESIKIHDQSCVVVVSAGNADDELNIALLVDEVSDVVEAEESLKQTIDQSYKPGYVSAALKHNEGLVMLLDAQKVFSDTDIISMKELLNSNK